MAHSDQTYQSAPINFDFKFKGEKIPCSYIRSYNLSDSGKQISYKVLFKHPEFSQKHGRSRLLAIDGSGKVVFDNSNSEEENAMLTKIVSALKRTVYLNGTLKDFYSQ